MKRNALSLLAFAFLMPACRTAAPSVTPRGVSPEDPLRAYLDEVRLLRPDGDKPRIRLEQRQAVRSGCAVAVRVRAASFDKGTARFSLETLGMPRVNDRRVGCRRTRPELELSISGFAAAAEPSQLRARVDAVLLTAEAYLASMGVPFDLPPGPAPAEAACREVFATNAESALARQVSAWPVPLLTVDPWYRDRSGRVRQESEVELEAVVGRDGRLHRPQLRTSLGQAHEQAVLRTLPLWRFTPARRGSVPVPARVALRPALRIY